MNSQNERNAEKVEKDQLDLNHEVYVDWSYEFVHWHNQLFQGRQPKLALSIMNQLQFFCVKGIAGLLFRPVWLWGFWQKAG